MGYDIKVDKNYYSDPSNISNTFGLFQNALKNPSGVLKNVGMGSAMTYGVGALTALVKGASIGTALTTGGLGSVLGTFGLSFGGAAAGTAGGVASTAGLIVPGILPEAGGAIAGGGIFGGLSTMLSSTASFLVTNPVGWAILGGIAAAFIVKAFWGRGLAKAKKNWSKGKDAIMQQLAAQGITGQDADTLANQMAFDKLSSKDKKKLLKKAKKSPNGEAAQIVNAAGYDANTGQKKIGPDGKPMDFARIYYEKTGKAVAGFNVDFKSSANSAELAAATTQYNEILTQCDIDKDGKISENEVQAYFTANFGNKSEEQVIAELKNRGYQIDTKSKGELRDSTGKITAESFAAYIFAEGDQKGNFVAQPDGSILAQSDKRISVEEFAEVFIAPKQSDWQDKDGQSEMAEFLTELQGSDSGSFNYLIDAVKKSQTTTTTPTTPVNSWQSSYSPTSYYSLTNPTGKANLPIDMPWKKKSA